MLLFKNKIFLLNFIFLIISANLTFEQAQKELNFSESCKNEKLDDITLQPNSKIVQVSNHTFLLKIDFTIDLEISTTINITITENTTIIIEPYNWNGKTTISLNITGKIDATDLSRPDSKFSVLFELCPKISYKSQNIRINIETIQLNPQIQICTKGSQLQLPELLKIHNNSDYIFVNDYHSFNCTFIASCEISAPLFHDDMCVFHFVFNYETIDRKFKIYAPSESSHLAELILKSNIERQKLESEIEKSISTTLSVKQMFKSDSNFLSAIASIAKTENPTLATVQLKKRNYDDGFADLKDSDFLDFINKRRNFSDKEIKRFYYLGYDEPPLITGTKRKTSSYVATTYNESFSSTTASVPQNDDVHSTAGQTKESIDFDNNVETTLANETKLETLSYAATTYNDSFSSTTGSTQQNDDVRSTAGQTKESTDFDNNVEITLANEKKLETSRYAFRTYNDSFISTTASVPQNDDINSTVGQTKESTDFDNNVKSTLAIETKPETSSNVATTYNGSFSSTTASVPQNDDIHSTAGQTKESTNFDNNAKTTLAIETKLEPSSYASRTYNDSFSSTTPTIPQNDDVYYIASQIKENTDFDNNAKTTLAIETKPESSSDASAVYYDLFNGSTVLIPQNKIVDSTEGTIKQTTNFDHNYDESDLTSNTATEYNNFKTSISGNDSSTISTSEVEASFNSQRNHNYSNDFSLLPSSFKIFNIATLSSSIGNNTTKKPRQNSRKEDEQILPFIISGFGVILIIAIVPGVIYFFKRKRISTDIDDNQLTLTFESNTQDVMTALTNEKNSHSSLSNNKSELVEDNS